jgi:hypothetical protein
MNFRSFTITLGLALLAAASVHAGNVKLPPLILPHAKTHSLNEPLVGRFAVLPARDFNRSLVQEQSRAVQTLPLWSKGLTAGGVHYVYEMVGLNPFVTHSNQTSNIKAYVIPVKLIFTDFGNAVFDPSAKDTTCSVGAATSLVKQSPLFNPVVGYPGGTYVGTGEYVDLFQRANYFAQTNPSGLNPNYHVNLAYTSASELTVNVSGGDVFAGSCGNIGLMDFTTWNNYLQSIVFPALASQSLAPPNSLPVFLLYNVVLYDGSESNCCILGYHSAFNDPSYGGAFHTYSSVEFDTNRSFTGVSDTSAMSHEIAEWMDDPAGNNPTPSWGNIGQVVGCQANLEVGDPLSGTLTQIYMPADRYTYHVQDLAFTPWFYRQGSTSVNGWYSLMGTFLSPSAPC